jgi:uncharacterized protein with von Willebrand factor type A (vWA) domain
MEEEKQQDQGDTFEGLTTDQKIAFLANELRVLKKQVEVHTHNIAQIVREVRRLNEQNWANEIDDLKMRLNEIQAKPHRKFAGRGEEVDLGSLDNMD